MSKFVMTFTDDELEILASALEEHTESTEASVNWKYRKAVEELLEKITAATP